MSCVLQVSGENFAVDDFLKRNLDETEKVWHKGDQDPYQLRPPRDTSGFNLAISNADFKDLKKQIQDAVDFLNECSRFLLKLEDYPGIDNITLDFGVAFKEDVAAQFTHFPAELIRLAGTYNMAIEVSHYWVSDEAECDC